MEKQGIYMPHLFGEGQRVGENHPSATLNELKDLLAKISRQLEALEGGQTHLHLVRSEETIPAEDRDPFLLSGVTSALNVVVPLPPSIINSQVPSQWLAQLRGLIDRWCSWTRQASLFLSLIILLLAAPFYHGNLIGENILGVLLVALLIFAIYGIWHISYQLLIAVGFGVITFTYSWFLTVYDSMGLETGLIVLRLLFLGFVVGSLVTHVATSQRASLRTVYAGISAFILIGLLWGGIYNLLHQLQPGSFSFNTIKESSHSADWMDFLFFSLVTLTTVGYGDITPVTDLAKSLAAAEGIVGVLYCTVLISRLVSLYEREREYQKKPEPSGG